METVDLYVAAIEKGNIYKQEIVSRYWKVIGLFENEDDAKKAVKLYQIAHRAIGEKVLNNSSVEKKSFSQGVVRKFYKSLDEFINDDLNIKRYLEVNKLTAGEQLDEINQAQSKAEKELRIIERLIKEYNDKLHFALMTSSTSEESIEKIEESIKYLESLRKKTGLVK